MAYDWFGPTLELDAAADLSALQYRFVFVDSNGRAAQNVTSGGRCDGVLQNKPAALGQSATVVKINGGAVSKVVAGAAVAAGALVMSDTVGRAITATSTNYVLGRALRAAGVAGDIIPVLLGTGGALL